MADVFLERKQQLLHQTDAKQKGRRKGGGEQTISVTTCNYKKACALYMYNRLLTTHIHVHVCT